MGFRELLKFRGFTLLWCGQIITRIGDAIETLALMWIALELTGSALFMGGVGICSAIPNLLFMAVGGVCADRWSRKRVMVICDIARGSIIMSIPILYNMGALQPYHILIVAFSVSIFESFFTPSFRATIPNLVDEKNLMAAMSANTMTSSLANIIGMGVGGSLIYLVTAPNAVLIDGLSFFASAIFITAIHVPFSKRAPSTTDHPTIRSDLKEGLNFIRKQDVLLAILIMGLILNLAFAPIAIAIPILSERVLDTGALGYAWLMMSWAVGMLIGSIAIGQWGNRFRKRSTLLYGGIGVGVPLCFVSLLNTLTPCIIMFFILGLFLSVINIPINTLMQEVTPDPIRGRVTLHLGNDQPVCDATWDGHWWCSNRLDWGEACISPYRYHNARRRRNIGMHKNVTPLLINRASTTDKSQLTTRIPEILGNTNQLDGIVIDWEEYKPSDQRYPHQFLTK